MRRMFLAAPALFLICSANQHMRVGLDQVPPGSKCTQSAALDAFIGKTASTELGAQLMAAARAPALRWVPAGAPAPKDSSARRLTVQLDAQSRVVSARCG